jgi:hypothetical protein
MIIRVLGLLSFMVVFTCKCHLRRVANPNTNLNTSHVKRADLTIDFHVSLSQAKSDIHTSHVNTDDQNIPNNAIRSYSTGKHANLTCPPNASSKARVPDRHSPRNQRVICPHERAAPAALALTGACIRPHAASAICLLYARCTPWKQGSLRVHTHTHRRRRRDRVPVYLLSILYE